jgi:hypothetical protein
VLLVRAGPPDPLAAFTAVGQITMFGVAVLSSAVAIARRDRFDQLSGGVT